MSNEETPVKNLLLPHWHYPVKLKGLSGIYLNTAIRNLAMSLVGIFIPIYVYKVTGSLVHTFLFYTFWNFITLISTIPIAKFVHKIGPDFSMFASNITRSLYLLFLIFGGSSPLLFWISPIFGAITTPLYFLSYHSAFSSQSKVRKMSRQIANISNITRFVSIFAPLAGGIIATSFGFNALLPSGIFLLLASSLPIFLDEYDKNGVVVSLDKVKKETLTYKHTFIAFFFQGFVSDAESIVWPLLLFVTLPNFEKIGGLTTATLILSMLIIHFLAKKINHFHKEYFQTGGFFLSLIWFLRGIVFNPIIAILSAFIYEIFSIFTYFPYNILIYKTGKERQITFFAFREMAIHSGTMTFCFLAACSIRLGLPWMFITLVAATATFLFTYFLLRGKPQEETNN